MLLVTCLSCGFSFILLLYLIFKHNSTKKNKFFEYIDWFSKYLTKNCNPLVSSKEQHTSSSNSSLFYAMSLQFLSVQFKFHNYVIGRSNSISNYSRKSYTFCRGVKDKISDRFERFAHLVNSQANNEFACVYYFCKSLFLHPNESFKLVSLVRLDSVQLKQEDVLPYRYLYSIRCFVPYVGSFLNPAQDPIYLFDKKLMPVVF